MENTIKNEFEQLLDDYHYEAPKRGDIFEGEIESIQEDAILINVGLKRAAIVPPREVKNMDDASLNSLSVGDMIPIYVTQSPVGSQNLLVSIEKASIYENWLEAQEMLDHGDVAKLPVVGINRGGLLVQFKQLQGFMPNSHVPELKKLRNPKMRHDRKQKMVGSEILVKPIEVDQKRKKLVFSAADAQEEKRLARLLELKEGDVVRGKVTNIVDFGVFVDLGDIDGLIHISEVDWQRIDYPSDVLNIGDEIDVLVKDVDIERERVSLSRKALIPCND